MYKKKSFLSDMNPPQRHPPAELPYPIVWHLQPGADGLHSADDLPENILRQYRDQFWDQIDLWPKKYVNQAKEWWKNWNVKGVSKKRKNKDYKKILEGNIPHYDVTTL